MNEQIRNVTLAFPCREQWDKFEVVAGGRLCTNCAHVVRDFRDCTSGELQAEVKVGGRVCGVFTRDQLSPSFVKAAAAAVLMTAATGCLQEVGVSEMMDHQVVQRADTPEDESFVGVIIGDELTVDPIDTLTSQAPHESSHP